MKNEIKMLINKKENKNMNTDMNNVTNTETNQTVTPVKRGRKAYVLPEGVVVDWTQTDKQIAVQLGKSSLTIFKLRHRSGVLANKRGRRTGVKVV